MSGQLIQNLFKTIDDRHWTSLRQIFTDDIVYERPGYAPIEGFTAVLNFYKNVRIIADGHHELDGVVCDESFAAAWGSFQGVSRDGQPLSERFADIYSLRDGRIWTRASYFFRPAV